MMATSDSGRKFKMQKPNPPANPDWSSFTVSNPEEFVRNMLTLWSEGGRAMAGLLERADAKGGPYSTASEMTEASRIISEVARQWMTDPGRTLEAQGDLVKGYMDVWTAAVQRMAGQH